MAQEFTIKSQEIEDKINQLLPTQGGFAPCVDFSASTMVIPIVDLTETAEGSSLRQDLQTSLGHNTITAFGVTNTTTTLIVTTGYYRVFGVCNIISATGTAPKGTFTISDGTTDKTITEFDTRGASSAYEFECVPFDFNVFIEAGHSLSATSNAGGCKLTGCTRQIADLQGNLVNP